MWWFDWNTYTLWHDYHNQTNTYITLHGSQFVKNAQGLLSQQISSIQHSIINYSHHAVYEIPRAY